MMKFSEIKTIKGFAEDGWRDAVDSIYNGEPDFEAGCYRFIRSDMIDEIMQDELAGDEYMLGCFNAWFLADVLGIDQDVIAAMQQAEAYAAVGKLILSMGKLEELQQGYASADGYGHHFNRYDGGEDEINIDGATYHVFRT